MSNTNPLLNNDSVQGAAKSIEGLMDTKGVIKKPQKEAAPVEPKEEVEAKAETETEVEQQAETQQEETQEVAEQEEASQLGSHGDKKFLEDSLSFCHFIASLLFAGLKKTLFPDNLFLENKDCKAMTNLFIGIPLI